MKNRHLHDVRLGTGLLALALLMGQFLPPSNLTDFIKGALVGLSIVFNLRYGFKRFGKMAAHS
jgi:hypothetical protein